MPCPVFGWLRPEGYSGNAFLLVCSSARYELEFRRIPAQCGRKGTAVFLSTSPSIPRHVVESCETFKHYLRTIDLHQRRQTAIPVVDDLTSFHQLVVRGHGYTRFRKPVGNVARFTRRTKT